LRYGDLFHEDVATGFILETLQRLVYRQNVVWQVLTKRPDRMRQIITESFPEGWFHERASNIWLGVSCENQHRADERIPILLDTPAAVRWISAEPLLGAIDFRPWLFDGMRHDNQYKRYEYPLGLIHQIVVGAESGPNRRLFDVAWAADILHQCQEADISCFLKQGSALRPGKPLIVDGREWKEWPSD